MVRLFLVHSENCSRKIVTNCLETLKTCSTTCGFSEQTKLRGVQGNPQAMPQRKLSNNKKKTAKILI